MRNLLVKGYTRRMDDSLVGRMWYIPHHGVYPPLPPPLPVTQGNRVVFVVFDCSSQFAEKPLNQELLTGPDLTDPIIRVLNKFRLG